MTKREMRERRGTIAAEMADLSKPENWNGEARAKFDLLDKEQDGLRLQIESIEGDEARAKKAADLEAEMRASNGRKPPEGAIDNGGGQPSGKDSEQYRRAFRSYLKFGYMPKPNHGIIGINDEARSILSKHSFKLDIQNSDLGDEYRDMVSGGQGAYPGATTGFFVPVGFQNEIEQAMKWYGPMLDAARIITTSSGQQLPFPTSNDTNISGEQVGEGAQVTTADVTLGEILFGAWKFSTKLVKVSIELMQDSAFDLDSFLQEQFAVRLGRILNTKFTTGAGTTTPNGIVTASGIGISGTTTPAIIGNDNAGSPDPTTQVGALDFVNLEHSVDKAYRGPGAAYMLHDSTLRYVKTLKDLYGRQLWQAGMKDGEPDKINGYPFWVNNDMATLAASAKTVLFGQLKKYVIRKVRDLQVARLEERFAEYGQVAFIGFARYDGNLVDAGTGPVKVLQQHS